jgi:hypothetical protein
MIMQAVTHPPEIVRAIGELCVSGDWACAEGDLQALHDIVLELAAYVAEPLHCYLAELADACGADPGRAVALWDQLKGRIHLVGRGAC